MWELIRANKIHSIMLMVVMAVVLLALGFIIGMVFFGPGGGIWGLIIATGIWTFLTLISFSSGDAILLASSKAKRVTHADYPQLFNIVEEMSISAGLPMPKVYIIAEPAPNAFATGRKPETASVAVTAGLLGRLNRDELQGVIAHEMSHILHRDILFVTLAGIMLGSIVILSQVFLRSMFYSSMMGSRRRYSAGGRGNAQAQLIMLVIAIIAAILAPIMAYLFYFALSRKREYMADAGAARLTRYPEGLANALAKIANDHSPQLTAVNKVTAPMYIANPFKKKKQMKLSDLTSTHPPISQRIKILRAMTHGASTKDYSDAYCTVTHSKSVVPTAAITKEEITLRETSVRTKRKQQLEKQSRQVGDIMRQVNGFLFLTCDCGLKLKIPPDYKPKTISCPRCSRKLDVTSK